MIKSFADKETEKIFNQIRSRRFPANIQTVAFRKLLMIHAAESIQDLKVPPGNRLEELKGDRKGQWSIRINKQYRICFKVKGNHFADVEITDYH